MTCTLSGCKQQRLHRSCTKNKHKAGQLLGLGSIQLKQVQPRKWFRISRQVANKAEIPLKQMSEGPWDYFWETFNKLSTQNTKFQVLSLSFTRLRFAPLKKWMQVLFFWDLSLKKGFITVSSLLSLTLFFDDSSECSTIWKKRRFHC